LGSSENLLWTEKLKKGGRRMSNTIWKKIFEKDTQSSRNTANDRLRVVLSNDRLSISPEIMETLKEEILTVIARHIDIFGAPEVNIIHEGRQTAVDISIPIKGR
jgi:cell division topological specificity factor